MPSYQSIVGDTLVLGNAGAEHQGQPGSNHDLRHRPGVSPGSPRDRGQRSRAAVSDGTDLALPRGIVVAGADDARSIRADRATEPASQRVLLARSGCRARRRPGIGTAMASERIAGTAGRRADIGQGPLADQGMADATRLDPDRRRQVRGRTMRRAWRAFARQVRFLSERPRFPNSPPKAWTRSTLSGTTRNPWDLSKTPGGSSGGAAAATAAGMGVIALASDAAGSIRHPCALTGLYGLKPTFGLVPDWPPSYLGSLAVIGPIARSVRDCALALDVIARPDLRDPLRGSGSVAHERVRAGCRNSRAQIWPIVRRCATRRSIRKWRLVSAAR